MDAKHAKTLSGVVALLLVTSLFAAVPFTVAQSADEEVVVFDADETDKDGYFVVDDEDEPRGPITYNSTWGVTFSNLSESGEYALYFGSDVPDHAVEDTYDDGSHSGKFNVTFLADNVGASSPPAGKFDRVGQWNLAWFNETTDAWDVVGHVEVSATENLNVVLSPGEITYSGERQTFTVTVTDADTGEPVSGASVDTDGLTSRARVTGSDGRASWATAPTAGEYTISVTKHLDDNAGANDPAEFMGESTLTVNAQTLDITAISTNAFHGFSGDVKYRIADEFDASSKFVLHVVDPDGCHAWWNSTIPLGNSPTATEGGDDCDEILSSADLERGVVDEEDVINVTLSALGTWTRGQYTLDLGASVDGDDDAEYLGTAQWSTRAPASLNLESDKEKFSAVPGLSGGDLNAQSLTVTVTLDEEGLHPSWDSQDQFRENVTIEGDFLTLVSDGDRVAPSIGDYNTSGDGKFTIDRLYLTNGGAITVTVTVGDDESTLEIPIEKGGSLEADKEELVVDVSDTITFTLRGPSGAVSPYGKVSLYRVADADAGTLEDIDTSKPRSIRGDGSDGRGENGQYAFALEEKTLATYVAVGEVGEQFAYTTFRVVPAHDITSEIRENSTFLATDSKTVRVNATLGDGSVLDQKPDIYILNSGQLETFLENPGELPAPLAQNDLSEWKDEDDELLGYEFDFSTADPDTYTLYIVSRPDGKHDNLESLTSFTIEHAGLQFDPSGIASNANIQRETNVTFNLVDHEGEPMSGKVRVHTDSLKYIKYVNDTDEKAIASPYEITVEDGVAYAFITGEAIGSVEWEFQAEDGSGWAPALGTFEVLGPNIEFTPSELDLTSNRLTVAVRSLDGEPLADLNVTVCGFPLGGDDECAGTETTDADGVVTLGFNPSRTGDLFLYVENLDGDLEKTESKVRVTVALPTLRITADSQVEEGDEVGIFVGEVGAGTRGIEGVQVTVTSAGETVFDGATDAAGLAKWTPDSAGTYTIAASKSGFRGDEVAITVAEKPEEPPVLEPNLQITGLALSPSSVELGSVAQGIVTVENSGNGAGSANLAIRVDGVNVGMVPVTLEAGESDQYSITWTPNVAGDFSVTANLGGSEAGPETLTVEKPEDTEPQVPTDPQGPVPGFGVVAFALAALGVALVIGRRRN